MFTDTSRYKTATQYEVRDHRGRKVKVAATPTLRQQPLLGFHVLKQGQRADHLAARYLNDATAFWKLADINDAMLPERLSEQSEIAIPAKR